MAMMLLDLASAVAVLLVAVSGIWWLYWFDRKSEQSRSSDSDT